MHLEQMKKQLRKRMHFFEKKQKIVKKTKIAQKKRDILSHLDKNH